MGAHRKCRALCFVRRCVPYQKKGDRADVRKVLASADATELASSRPRIAELTSEIENLAELAAKTGQADVYARLIGDRESERRVLQDAVRQATTVPVDFPALRSSMVKRVREMRGWFVEAGDDARHALQMLLGDRRLAVHHDDEYSVADRGILQGAVDSSGSRALDPRRGARDWQSFGGSGGSIRPIAYGVGPAAGQHAFSRLGSCRKLDRTGQACCGITQKVSWRGFGAPAGQLLLTSLTCASLGQLPSNAGRERN